MKNNWALVGGIFGFLAVALGAFGAHSLKTYINPELLETYKTGVLYHLIHSAVIFAIGVYSRPEFFKSALFFSAGIILFSFSLYIYSITSYKPLAMVTPFGGVCFLIGWLLVIVIAVRLNKKT